MEARKRGTPSRDSDLESIVQAEEGMTSYASMEATTNTEKDGIVVADVSPREDSHIRSLSKGLTWRFVASGTTIVIAKLVTGETTIAFQIGFFEFFAKIMIYYVHERIWAKIRL